MLTVLNVGYPLAPAGPDAVGGSEQILTALDAALAAEGHRSLVVACEGSQTADTLIATPRSSGEYDGEAMSAAHREHRAAIHGALAAWNVDVVHMHGVDFYWYLPPPEIPTLVTLHLPLSWYPGEIFHLERPRTFLHCVSAAQARACPPGAPMLPPIENGVAVPRDLPAVRGGYALALGRVCPEKGFHLALDAAARADVPLVLAGKVFPYRAHREYFRAEIRPRLVPPHRFIGPVGRARKHSLLAEARCLLIPSLAEETSSLVALEAMACGTPVIAFPAGALAEVVRHGETGFLVQDVLTMSQAIRRAPEIDPEACRAHVRERYSLERMIARYFEVYRRCSESNSLATFGRSARSG